MYNTVFIVSFKPSVFILKHWMLTWPPFDQLINVTVVLGWYSTSEHWVTQHTYVFTYVGVPTCVL